MYNALNTFTFSFQPRFRSLLPLLLLAVLPITHAKQAVILDTDMAMDDWFTLLYLAKNPEVELLAVTVSNSGEALCQNGLDNAKNLLTLAGHKPIPVACGDAYPIDGYFVFPAAWQKDANTLSGVDLGRWLDKPLSKSRSDGHAVELIHRSLGKQTTPVSIVAVGPMTNVAQWLLKYPDDKLKVDQLVMMGGAYRVKGNIIVPNFTDNNPNKVSEWNYFIDPVAAKIVLEADGLNKVMVGLDVTNTVRVTHAFADRFKQHVSDQTSQFVDLVLDNNRWFIESGEYYMWDVMAAIVSVKRGLCEGDDVAVTALAQAAPAEPYLGSSDITIPSTTTYQSPRQHLNTATAGQVVDSALPSKTKICLKTHTDTIFNEFIGTLTR